MYIAIDFGTCNTVISNYKEDGIIYHYGNPYCNSMLIPSSITFLEGIPNNKNEITTENYIIGESYNVTFEKFKRTLGTHFVYKYNNIEFTSQDLVTLYFKGLKKLINMEDVEIIATIPAHFNDKQRNELVNAITNANFKLFRLYNEPTCAAIYYIHKFNSNNSRFIVLDIGGGTLDITTVEYNKELNICDIVDIYGNSALGGYDIDKLIVEQLPEHYKNKENIAEEIKIALSYNNSYTYYADDDSTVTFTRNRFDNIIKDIIDKMLENLFVMIEKWDIKLVEQIVFVGGPTHIPLLQNRVKSYFKTETECNIFKNDLHKSIVADGATLLYNIIKNKNEFTLLDILPMDIGIKVNNEIKTVLEKGCKIPSKTEYEFTTSRDGQRNIDIEIFEDNVNIGSYTITNIPITTRGNIVIQTVFSLNSNSILEVYIKNIVKDQNIVQDHKIQIISMNKKMELIKKLLALNKH